MPHRGTVRVSARATVGDVLQDALPTVPAATPRIDRATYERLARRARVLSWLSLAWMTVEGGVAISAGLVASSIALVGFGLDSAIEGFASLVIVWRFSRSRMLLSRGRSARRSWWRFSSSCSRRTSGSSRCAR